MDDKERQAALLSALTTEHFVMQTAANATVSEQGTRASLYILALSSSLVAMGFAAQSRAVFVPFVATVLPALFLLGVFTVVRLVDAAMEYNLCLTRIARLRAYYRTLSPEAAAMFSARSGRWPESGEEPTLRLGEFIAFATTIASMVAFINSIVAGVGVALLAGDRLGADQAALAMLLGVLIATALVVAFVAYERWRFRTFEQAERSGKMEDRIDAHPEDV
jgi:membrane protein YdbS with pleckstrin-like domain